MNGNIFLRTGILLILIGAGFGIFMGISQDHIQAPTHAHLNLVGGVWMFLAGLFYNAHPQISRKWTMSHYALTVIGLLFFIPGIYAAQIQAPWTRPTVEIGSMLTLAQFVLFAFLVFKGTGKSA